MLPSQKYTSLTLEAIKYTSFFTNNINKEVILTRIMLSKCNVLSDAPYNPTKPIRKCTHSVKILAHSPEYHRLSF
jgi:hypothetical protein